MARSGRPATATSGSGSPLSGLEEGIVLGRRALAIGTAIKYANVHNEMWKPWVARY